MGNGNGSVPDLERLELKEILSSKAFARSPRLAKLLEYIAEKHFRGEDNQVREYNIGTDVLGRPADFDPAEDAIARVEIHRLRKKLRDFYAEEGAHHAVKIFIPPGTYTPVFVRSTANGRTEELNGDPVPASAVPFTPEKVVSQEEGRRTLPRRWRGWLVFVGLCGIAVLALTVWPERKSKAADISPTVSAAPPDAAVRFIAGYEGPQYVDHYGHVWLTDRYSEGGNPATAFRQFIARTSDPALYEAGRMGMAGYNIPLKPGNYELKLHFAETVYGAGSSTGGGENSRVYSVTANGKMLLENFDIVSDAGGSQIADVRVFKDIHPGPDGLLRLRFFRQRDVPPLVNAIEVESAQPHKLNPIRIVTQSQAVKDSHGQIWSADTYYQGGQVGIHSKAVSATSDPDLYVNERYGHFSYALPVTDGSYTLTLHFAETYWGPDNPGGGGARRRVFDVYCNGTTLLKNFDIFQQVGSNEAVVKTFHGVRGNAQGKLNVEFVPVVNYAAVNAIEVLDEGR